MQKHLSDPLDCLIEWCENNSEIKDKYPLIINNAKDELKKLRKKAESCCEKKDKGCIKNQKKIDEFFKLFTEEWIEQKQAELKRISFQEFKIMVDEYLAKNNLRQGQTIMNVLGDTLPEIYREITGTELDCFYDDEKSNKLLNYLEIKLSAK